MNIRIYQTRFYLIAFFAFLFTPDVSAQSIQKSAQGLSLSAQGMDISIEFYSENIVRIFKTPAGKPYDKKSLSVIGRPVKTAVTFLETGKYATIKSNSIQLSIDTESGGIFFSDLLGQKLLHDKDYGTQFSAIDDAGTPSFKVRNGFLLDKDEAIYGVGQILDNKFNRRNSSHHMQNENMSTYSPYFLSVKGYAVFWDNYSISEFNDNPQELSFESLGHCADYYFMYGKNADGVISKMRELTGKAPMLPLWAYGFFQSKERYHTQEESLNIVKKYRELKVPLDVVIQDWRYWPEYNKTDSAWNSQSFDSERFPDPKKWVDDIHKLNAKLLIVTWPGFGPKTQQRKEFDRKKMIINFDTWPPNSGARPYDVFNPEALNIYWKYLDKGIFSYIGNDGWWLDSTEPDHINIKPSDFNLPTYLGSYRSVKNGFSLMHNKGIATYQREVNNQKRGVILTRSGFIGQQRYGSNTWSGDVNSTWEMLEKQIPAALNYTLMGIPNWNSDIGGFFAGRWVKGGGNKNPEFQELYVRWMQFGAFSPMMRAHGTNLPREIWNFGDRGTWCFDAQEKFIKLRYSLLPYIYATSWEVSKNDGTFMRPLMMDFAEDKKTHEIGSQYLFGKSILVTPVTRYQARKWPVYLPKGNGWYNFWTKKYYNGGQTIETDVPVDIVPLYVKTGAIIPFGPDVQYSTEKKWDNLNVRVYAGADGEFVLYEDENDNYNYEKGYYTTIIFKWNDKSKTLFISDQKGSFKGMLARRNFNLELISANSTVRKGKSKNVQSIVYSGKEVEIKF
ncbi:glycoside hydrolase family 31 protein [Pedobacter sp. MC2016-05]|uniref:glycoside hydrolase family 31 protein n=1 Tax=Pedobacter sp. MC2016-05 TaxID=2994474 RepID=UPI0022468F38|nr:glycoside hydrolase family 31 protein [Pedobacter sp. MC2016-05]MCX2473499.1 glycoside hydrolase family 31 protein [Pedobacter sp. MC2016-05]